MTLTITHNKVATLPDQAGAEVNKAEWNDAHGIAGDLSGYTITVSQISNATITAGSSVSGTNTGDQNLAPYLTSATAASTYVPQTTTVNGQALSGNITITNISGNAATVTTNANLTGPITSVGNATSITSQTGTGTTFAMSASPTFTGTVNNAREIITSTSATAFTVGANGSTNPILSIDASTASVATGISIKGAAAGSGIVVSAISSGTNETLSITSKGTGYSLINSSATGNVGIWTATPLCALDIGGLISMGAINGMSPILNLSSTMNSIAGAEFRNTSSGTAADFRFAVSANDATNYVAVFVPSTGNTGTLFGQTRSGISGVLSNNGSNGSPNRIFVIGNVANADLLFGTNNAEVGRFKANGDLLATTGNILINTAGKGLSVKSGSNARIGTGTLTAGTVTIANTSVTANTRVFLQDTTSGGLTNVGVLTAVTTAGTGFVVTSTLALDTSTFNWILMESA